MALYLDLPKTHTSDNRAFETVFEQAGRRRELKDIRQERREREVMDRLRDDYQNQALGAIAATFPTTGGPGLSEQQNRWIGENAGQVLQFRNGPALLQNFRALVDNTLQFQADAGIKALQIEDAKRKAEIFRLYGDDPNGPLLYQEGKSIEQFREEFRKNNLPIPAQIPAELINPETGRLNQIALYNEIAKAQQSVSRATPTTERERAIVKLQEIDKVLANPESFGNVDVEALKKERSLYDSIINRGRRDVDLLNRMMFSEFESKLRELNQINKELDTEEIKDATGQFTERGTLLMKRRRLAEESIEGIKKRIFSEGEQAVPLATPPAASERPSNVPTNYVRARDKKTGQLGWADPTDPNVEIIQP